MGQTFGIKAHQGQGRGRQTSELLFLTSTTMKAFIVLSLAATALAVPARGGRRQGGKNAQKKERIDPGNILRCTAENFGNNQTIKDCIDQPCWINLCTLRSSAD